MGEIGKWIMESKTNADGLLLAAFSSTASWGYLWGASSQGQPAYITERQPSLFLLLLEQPIFNCYTRVIWPRSSRQWQLRRIADLSTFNQLTSLCKAESVHHLQNSTAALNILFKTIGPGSAAHVRCLVSVTVYHGQVSMRIKPLPSTFLWRVPSFLF